MGLVNRESNPDSYRDKSQKSEVGTAVNEQQATGDLFTIHHPIAIGSLFTTRVAIFASGAGSNAQKIIDHFRQSGHIKISLIVCNKPGAGVLNIAARENIPAILIDKEKFFRGNAYTDELKETPN